MLDHLSLSRLDELDDGKEACLQRNRNTVQKLIVCICRSALLARSYFIPLPRRLIETPVTFRQNSASYCRFKEALTFTM